MGSANQKARRLEYRNHSYELSVNSYGKVVAKIYKMGSDTLLVDPMYFHTEAGLFRSAETVAVRAVRDAHTWARDCIDGRMVVQNAIDEVDPSTCRGLKK
jgi:hypothetical protein